MKSQLGWKTLGVQSHQNQLGKRHVNLERLKQQVEGLYRSPTGLLHMCYSFQFSIFMEILSV